MNKPKVKLQHLLSLSFISVVAYFSCMGKIQVTFPNRQHLSPAENQYKQKKKFSLFFFFFLHQNIGFRLFVIVDI